MPGVFLDVRAVGALRKERLAGVCKNEETSERILWSMKVMKWMRLAGMMVMACVATSLMSGCDDGGDDAGGGNALVGTWEMYVGDTVQGEPTYWWTFNADGTWYGADSKGGGAHYSGTYTVSGNSFEGPFVNGSVGDGKIEGTFEGEDMTVDFIEYWHDPAKHNPLVGRKLP